MKRILYSALAGLATIAVTSQAWADDQPGWFDQAWNEVAQTYRQGSTELYLPFHTLHAPWAYSKEKIAEYQNWPVGFGNGRGLFDDKGNWHGVYVMGFQDSHYKPEWIAGYGWKTYWHLGSDARLGLGYTAGFTTRADYGNYMPIPLLLPIASADYGKFSLESAYVPGGKGNGNVFFMWAKWRLDGKSSADGSRR
jgi:Antimicrobial peptide resistance and lipid A acylation protein PagP